MSAALRPRHLHSTTAALALGLSLAAPAAVRAQQAAPPPPAEPPVAAPAPAAAPSVQALPPLVVEAATLDKPAPKTPKPAPAAAPPPSEPAPVPSAPGPAASGPSSPAPASAATGTASAASAPPSESSAGLPLDKVGSAVRVLTSEDLDRTHARTTADALRGVPGVEVNVTGGDGNLTQVRVRGSDAKETLVLIDGVEANANDTGFYDFSNLAPDQIERIEVIKGPQGGLYGSNASGGVVNIITKGGQGPLTLTGRAEVGSFGTRSYAAEAKGGTADLNGLLSVSVRDTKGFNLSPPGEVGNFFAPDTDGSRLTSLAFKGHAALTSFAGLDLVVRHTQNESARDGFGQPTPTAPYLTAVDDPSYLHNSTWLYGAQVRFDLLDGHLTEILKANRSDTTNIDYDFSGIPSGGAVYASENDMTTIKLSSLTTVRWDTSALVPVKHALSGLVERVTEDFTPSSNFGPLPFYPDGLLRERVNLGTALEYRGEFAGQLFFTQSVRHDAYESLNDYTTWRTTLAWKIPGTGFRPHASVGTGVRMPGMYELYGVAIFANGVRFVPNPSLTPETSIGWDSGLELTLLKGKLVLDTTFFDTNLHDRITGTGVTLTNAAGSSTRKGVETSLRLKFLPNASFGLGYTYLDDHNNDPTVEVRRPHNAGRADVTYAFDEDRAKVSFKVNYNGSMRDAAFDPSYNQVPVELKAYWLAGLGASYKLEPGVEVYGRVDNLFNQHYQEVYGYETAGIAGYAGIKLTFEDPGTRSWAAAPGN